MCKDENVRIIIKQGSGVPTIPVSADHRNGDWIATDIYEGESYMDTDTGLVYNRGASGIVMANGDPVKLVWKALVTQSGTNAPVLVVVENSLNVTVVSGYTGVGSYTLSGFDSNLTSAIDLHGNINSTQSEVFMNLVAFTSSSIVMNTSTLGAVADDVLDTIGSSITVTKYVI